MNTVTDGNGGHLTAAYVCHRPKVRGSGQGSLDHADRFDSVHLNLAYDKVV